MLKVIVEITNEIGLHVTTDEVWVLGIACLPVITAMALYAVILSIKVLEKKL